MIKKIRTQELMSPQTLLKLQMPPKSDQNLKQFLQRAKIKLHYSILFLEQQLRAGTPLAFPSTSGRSKFQVALNGCISAAFHSSSHLLLRTSFLSLSSRFILCLLWRGAGLSAGPQKFISLSSLLVAVGEDSEIWKWYAIKRKRLIEFKLTTWDLEAKVFCCNHPSS